MLSMRSITPLLPLSVYHEWANTQNQKTLLANKLMWMKIHEKELKQFFDEMYESALIEGIQDELPTYTVFLDIGFLVHAYNIAWDCSVKAEIAQLTTDQPLKP